MTNLETSAKGMGFAIVAKDEGTSQENLTLAHNEITAMQQNLEELRKVYTGDTANLDKMETLIQSTEELRTQFGNAVTEERWDDAADILVRLCGCPLSGSSTAQEIDSSASTTATISIILAC